MLDAGEPYDDTDASGKYTITGINPPATSAATRTFNTYSKTYRLREKLASGSGTGDWTCSYPNASTSGGFAAGNGSGFRCGHGPIDAKATPKATGKDFGNYRKVKPKITVIKALVPSSDAGRFDLKVDGTVVKAAAGDGGTGSTLVDPGHHQVTETAASGTTLADYAASISCLKNGKSAAATRTNGPGWVDVELRATRSSAPCATCAWAPSRSRSRPIPTRRTARASASRASPAAFSLADDGVKTFTRVTPRDAALRRSARTRPRATAWRRSAAPTATARPPSPPAPRASRSPRARRSAARSSTRSSSPACTWSRTAPRVVHHGDSMTFTFAVSNTGNSPLRDVHVTDDHCATCPPRRSSAATTTATPCSRAARCGSSAARWPCPRTRRARRTRSTTSPRRPRKDEEGTDVTASDDHCTDIIHPKIALDKTADRTTASVGDTIAYRFDVTNPGDVGLTVTKFERPAL